MGVPALLSVLLAAAPPAAAPTTPQHHERREYQGYPDRIKANAAAAWDELGS